MFDEKTIQHLKAYVYILVDPRSEHVFYIGKGNSNRVFNHVNLAIQNEDASSLKLDTIREIRFAGKTPLHFIVRHGLSDDVAFHIESALIDCARYLGERLTNIVAGHNSIENGFMSSDEVIAKYQSAPLEKLDSGFVIININQTYSRHAGTDAIYHATKGIWKMRNPTNDIMFVLSEYRGLIVEVFEVDRWYQQERGFGANSKKAGETYLGWGFDGHVAPQHIRQNYLYKSIAHKKKRGTANVIMYRI